MERKENGNCLNTLLVAKESKNWMNLLLVEKGRKKWMNIFSVAIQKQRWPTSKSVQAFLATVPHLYQVNGKTVHPGESQVMIDKDWGYVVRCEAQTHRQSLNLHQNHSCTIYWAGGKIGREKLLFIYISYCSTLPLVFLISLKCKNAGRFFLLNSMFT